jgi:nitroreductase
MGEIRMNSIFHRISVRKYQAKDVEQEKIEKLLRAAMAAPSACNQQPWEFYVVTNQDVIKALSEASPYANCAAEAPVIFVPCFRSVGIAPEYFNIDLSAAVENLLLEADAQELGAVWMGISPDAGRMEAVRKVLGIPSGLNPFALVPCGYPAEERSQEDRYEENRVHYVR